MDIYKFCFLVIFSSIFVSCEDDYVELDRVIKLNFSPTNNYADGKTEVEILAELVTRDTTNESVRTVQFETTHGIFKDNSKKETSSAAKFTIIDSDTILVAKAILVSPITTGEAQITASIADRIVAKKIDFRHANTTEIDLSLSTLSLTKGFENALFINGVLKSEKDFHPKVLVWLLI